MTTNTSNIHGFLNFTSVQKMVRKHLLIAQAMLMPKLSLLSAAKVLWVGARIEVNKIKPLDILPFTKPRFPAEERSRKGLI